MTKWNCTFSAIALAAGLLMQSAYAGPDGLLDTYRAKGAGPFSAEAGQAAWTRKFQSAKSPTTRSCSSCHGIDLRQAGKHVRTGKIIKPMAVSVNPDRLSDQRKVKKWLRRNCRWTMGRECSTQEKGDLIQFLGSL